MLSLFLGTLFLLELFSLNFFSFLLVKLVPLFGRSVVCELIVELRTHFILLLLLVVLLVDLFFTHPGSFKYDWYFWYWLWIVGLSAGLLNLRDLLLVRLLQFRCPIDLFIEILDFNIVHFTWEWWPLPTLQTPTDWSLEKIDSISVIDESLVSINIFFYFLIALLQRETWALYGLADMYFFGDGLVILGGKGGFSLKL